MEESRFSSYWLAKVLLSPIILTAPLGRTAKDVSPQVEPEMILALKVTVNLLLLLFLVLAHQQASLCVCHPTAPVRGKQSSHILIKTKVEEKLIIFMRL